MNPRQKFQFITAANITPAIVTFGSCFEAAFHSPISTTDNPSLTVEWLLRSTSFVEECFQDQGESLSLRGSWKVVCQSGLGGVGAIVGVIVGDSRTMEVSFFLKWLNIWHCWIWHKKVKWQKVQSSDVDSVMFQFGKTLEQRAILRS